MTTVAAAALVATWGVLVRLAFRRGRDRAARRLPPALVDELRGHKLGCLGEPPERVRLELLPLSGVAAPSRAPNAVSQLHRRVAAFRRRVSRSRGTRVPQ